MTIFDQGAALVPDVITEAEEERILLRISQAPWMTDLSRRVQHYGFRYNYRGPANGPARPRCAVPALGQAVIGERLTPLLRGGPARAVHRQRVPAGQGIGMHADHASFGPVVVSLSLGDAWTMNFRPRSARPYVREGLASDEVALLPRRSALVLRAARTLGVHARHRPPRQRTPDHDARLRDVPHGFVLISAAVSVRAEGKVPGHPAGVGADGEGEVVRSLEKGERGRDRERFPTRSSTHRHQPG